MQRCNATVRLNGDLANTVVKSGASPAEIVVLRHIHGHDAVVDIRVTGNDRGNAARHNGELDLLRSRYRPRVVSEVFPGAKPQLPETFSEIGIDGADDVELEDEPERNRQPVAKRGRKKQEPTPEVVTAADLTSDEQE